MGALPADTAVDGLGEAEVEVEGRGQEAGGAATIMRAKTRRGIDLPTKGSSW